MTELLELITDLLDEEVPLSAWGVSERGRKSLIMPTGQMRGRAEVRREMVEDQNDNEMGCKVVVEGDCALAPDAVFIRRGQYGKVLLEIDCDVTRKGQRYEVSAEVDVDVEVMAEAVGKPHPLAGRRIKS